MCRFVPEKQACVVERFGRYSRVLSSGLGITIPLACFHFVWEKTLNLHLDCITHHGQLLHAVPQKPVPRLQALRAVSIRCLSPGACDVIGEPPDAYGVGSMPSFAPTFVPVQIESVAYTHSLKELTLTVNTQQAITKDNVTIRIDGVLCAPCYTVCALSVHK